MREILFKAVSIAGKWVEGVPVNSVNGKCYMIHGATEDAINTNNEVDFYFTAVHPDTVCFASSRNDENKTRIFHNDIVGFTVFDHDGHDTQYTGIVQWTGDSFIIVNSKDDPYFGSDGPFDLGWVCDQDDTILVTGHNIHDDKLEGE